MNAQILTQRLGMQIRQTRRARGLTQEAMGSLAGLTRQKVIAIEKGVESVSMSAYARTLSALACEWVIAPMPVAESGCVTE